MKRVLTYGQFDVLDYENVALLKQSKELGDYLIVGLTTDSLNISSHKKLFILLMNEKKC